MCFLSSCSDRELRLGTAIGALVREAEHGESKKDFIHKLSIALKEANETEYWLELLYRSNYIQEEDFMKRSNAIKELLRLLISINLSSIIIATHNSFPINCRAPNFLAGEQVRKLPILGAF